MIDRTNFLTEQRLPESMNLDAMRTEEALALVDEIRGRANSQQLRASFFANRQDSYGFYIDLLMRMRTEKKVTFDIKTGRWSKA